MSRKLFIGRGFNEAMNRSQYIDYGPNMGKRKKPFWTKGYTFPEMEAFHEGTFDVGNPGLDPFPPDPTPRPVDCVEWIIENHTISGREAFGSDIKDRLRQALEDRCAKIEKETGDDCCTQLNLIITSCLQHNSLSFCICCAQATLENYLPFGTCDADFGDGADEDWRCCDGPCPTFSIQSLGGGCYKAAVSDCETRVGWELYRNGQWTSVSPDTNGMVCVSAGCEGILRATDICGESKTVNIVGSCSPTPTITCSASPCDEIVKSSSKTYTLTNSQGNVTWSVSGTGATINQSGVLTTDSTACGTLTVTATDDCCGAYAQQVRVTNGGTWVLVSNTLNTTTAYCGVIPPNYDEKNCSQCILGESYNCGIMSGGTLTNYFGTCALPSNPSIGVCTGSAPCNPCSGGNLLALRRTEIWEWRCP